MAKQRELTKTAERQKVRAQNARAEQNPVAAWKMGNMRSPKPVAMENKGRFRTPADKAK